MHERRPGAVGKNLVREAQHIAAELKLGEKAAPKQKRVVSVECDWHPRVDQGADRVGGD